jgi:hypothetical protein
VQRDRLSVHRWLARQAHPFCTIVARDGRLTGRCRNHLERGWCHCPPSRILRGSYFDPPVRPRILCMPHQDELSEGDSLGASPSCRYGFSRNGVLPGVWHSRSAAENRAVAERATQFFTKIASNLVQCTSFSRFLERIRTEFVVDRQPCRRRQRVGLKNPN